MEYIFSELGKFFMTHSRFIIGVIINLIIISVFIRITDTFTSKFEQRLRGKNPDSPLLNLMPVLTRIFKAIVIFMLLAGFLQSFGYNVASLIAGFGITGLAVGFAAKEAIGNVFGSIGLLADKVYKIGEYISFNGYEGTVENINLRSTTIRTLDGFQVNVPNNVLANEEITNVSQIHQRRIDISVDIEYGTSNEKIDRALEILHEVAHRDSRIKDGELSFIDNMAPSSIVVRLVAYTDKTSWADFILVKSEVLRQIIHRFREEGIEFAFPSTSVYMAK
ncbi:MAG: mechanosensitive ion channel family protein [Candidatus Gastranaerophilales bacterium]|nr:mechanosensitive ion channel family protein [Candidatus Gastranaerophilales bacterium]MCM1072862.1 mechanosensitive ion channel family protein [Bacteroides sp.]